MHVVRCGYQLHINQILALIFYDKMKHDRNTDDKATKCTWHIYTFVKCWVILKYAEKHGHIYFHTDTYTSCISIVIITNSAESKPTTKTTKKRYESESRHKTHWKKNGTSPMSKMQYRHINEHTDVYMCI